MQLRKSTDQIGAILATWAGSASQLGQKTIARLRFEPHAFREHLSGQKAVMYGVVAGWLSAAACAFVTFYVLDLTVVPVPEKVRYVELIANEPLPKTVRSALVAKLFYPAKKERFRRIRATLRQRLLAANEMVALAKSGTWSLARWAQLEAVQGRMDRDLGEFDSAYPEYRNFSFLRLFAELREAAPADDQSVAAAGVDASRLFELFKNLSPEMKNQEDVLLQLEQQIRTSKGLSRLLGDVPSYAEVRLNR